MVFALIKATPGDPVTVILGASPGSLSPATIAILRHSLGLDQPVYIQYFFFLERLLEGNLGSDIYTGIPVSSEIIQTLPRTLILTFTSLAIAIPIGVGAGIFSAIKHNSAIDNIISVVSLFAASVPSFWLGLI